MDTALAAGALVAAFVVPLATWFAHDAFSKGKQAAQVEQTKQRDERIAKLIADVDSLKLSTALDHQTVDGFCERIDDMRADMDKRFDSMRTDMDKRFDRIETLLSKKGV